MARLAERKPDGSPHAAKVRADVGRGRWTATRVVGAPAGAALRHEHLAAGRP